MCVLKIVVFPFVYFLLAIVLYVLLRYTDSDYPFGIFKLFLCNARLQIGDSLEVSLYCTRSRTHTVCNVLWMIIDTSTTDLVFVFSKETYLKETEH